MLILSTLQYFVSQIPLRFNRIIKHFTGLFLGQAQWRNPFKAKNPLDWLVHLFLFILDLFGFPEIYESIMLITKSHTRRLNNSEKKAVNSIFRESVNINQIKIDGKAILGPKQKRFAYVSYNTINYYDKISLDVLIHEVVHIWQYQTLGSIYIYEALKAQHSKEKYDYGGVEGLYSAMGKKKSLLDFNFEQQGDIVQDYYCLLQNVNGKTRLFQRGVYEYYLRDIGIEINTSHPKQTNS